MVRIIQDNKEFMNIANHNKYGLERVLSENYAFIAESTSLDLMDPDKRCQVYQVGQPLISVFHGVGMQKSMNNQSFWGYNLDLKSWFWSSSTPELAFLLIMEYSYSRISFFANYGVELLHN